MDYREVTGMALAFASLIGNAKAKLGARGQLVHAYSWQDYAGMRLWLAADNQSGFAVKPDGDIVSVWSLAKGRLAEMLAVAVANGGTKLDCFDPLAPVYQRHGFKVVGHDDWSDQYAPDGWDYAANGRPGVTYMARTSKSPGWYHDPIPGRTTPRV